MPPPIAFIVDVAAASAALPPAAVFPHAVAPPAACRVLVDNDDDASPSMTSRLRCALPIAPAAAAAAAALAGLPSATAPAAREARRFFAGKRNTLIQADEMKLSESFSTWPTGCPPAALAAARR